VIWRNVPFERELIEQRSLFDLPVSHHDLQSCLMQRLNQRTSCVATEDFFNRIDPKQTFLFAQMSPLTKEEIENERCSPSRTCDRAEVLSRRCVAFQGARREEISMRKPLIGLIAIAAIAASSLAVDVASAQRGGGGGGGGVVAAAAVAVVAVPQWGAADTAVPV
jgi:hypothetical protein